MVPGVPKPAARIWLPLLLLLFSAACRAVDVESELRQRLALALASEVEATDRYEIEVWLADRSARLAGRITDATERLELLRLIWRESARVALDPDLILAVIEIESRFDRFALSVAGAQGYMQVMPFWLAELGHPSANLFDPAINLRLGTTILRYYLDREKGDLERALARYNGSLGSDRYPRRVMQALKQAWFP
jgi:soluble lytic murein transglycosylase-like protein